jgi:dolichol-phosphate mannosyltransferase
MTSSPLGDLAPAASVARAGTAQLWSNLREVERARDAYWRRYPQTSPTRLRWRAHAARHALHIAPGDRVLELGAGSGAWTEHLAAVTGGESPITAAVFNADLACAARARELPGTAVTLVGAEDELPEERFDFVVGTAILSHDRYSEHLAWIHRLLKPGGRLLFFEANYFNPQVWAKAHSRRLARRAGNAPHQIALRAAELACSLRREGYEETEIVPYEILHPRTPGRLIPTVQSAAFVLEHLPGFRRLCGTLFIEARKPGRAGAAAGRPTVELARHDALRGAVSVVVPCHNEAMNVGRLVAALTAAYDAYLHEIVIVNDNSSDETAAVARALAQRDPRVRLVDRTPPPGVGRALRDGYAAASGRYILSIDCDFAMLVPELRDLFDAVAAGREGAIGSRFSQDSVLLNYPAAKLLGNRAFHAIARVVSRRPVHDVSNNLKLYRAEILRELTIAQDGFAANAETGLKPLLAGRDIVEVPIAWINRSADMGSSTFRVARVAPGYARALVRMLRGTRQGRILRRAPRERRRARSR